jgi:hypothetical protein
MSALLITALVGFIIPALVAVVTKESFPQWAKVPTESPEVCPWLARSPTSSPSWKRCRWARLLPFLPFEFGHGGLPIVGDPATLQDDQRCLQQNA